MSDPREVRSFGRPAEPAPPQVPPGQLPVQLPVVLVVDEASLRSAAAAISQMVAEAVRAGFASAFAEHDQARE